MERMTNPTIPAALGDFAFPPLGDTGKGPVQHEGKHGALYWRPDGSWRYYVTLQHDVPAVAYRCHFPGSPGASAADRSSPCDQKTAMQFIEWVTTKMNAARRARKLIRRVREQGFKEGGAKYCDAQIWQAILETGSGNPDVVAVHLTVQSMEGQTPESADGRDLDV